MANNGNYRFMKKTTLYQREVDAYEAKQTGLYYIPPGTPGTQSNPTRIRQLKEILKEEDRLNQIRAKVPKLSKREQDIYVEQFVLRQDNEYREYIQKQQEKEYIQKQQEKEYVLKQQEHYNYLIGRNQPLSSTKTQNFNYKPTSEFKKETTPLTPLQKIQQGLVTKIHSGRSTNGNDIITGQGYIDGGGGDDKIIGSASNDLIYGGAGNDVINSGLGSDYIFGGDGNDTIDRRNAGICTADGGAGIDTFILGKGPGYTKIQGYNPKEDRIDARECGIGDLRMQNGSIYIIAYGERGGSSIASLEGTDYKLTGNLKTDCQNLGITANQIGY